MLENVLVHEYMTHPVITGVPHMSVRLAHSAMCDHHIRHLPIIQDNQLVGILSSGDIRRAMPSSATSLSVWEIRALWDQVMVNDIMSRYLVTVKQNTYILEAVHLMNENRFNSLPVTDDCGALVGILTEVDVFRLLLRQSGEPMLDPEQTFDYPVAALP